MIKKHTFLCYFFCYLPGCFIVDRSFLFLQTFFSVDFFSVPVTVTIAREQNVCRRRKLVIGALRSQFLSLSRTIISLVFNQAHPFSFQAGLTDEQKAKLVQYYNDCLASTQVDKEVVAKARRGEFSDDPKLKEFFGCMFKKAGFQNDDGEIQVDVIRQKMPDDVDKAEADKVIAACQDKKGGTPAETAFEVYKCYWEATPNHISLA